MSGSELVVVHTFGNRQEADLATGALAAAGIEAIIQADSGGGMQPSIAWAGGVQVIVRAADAKAARAILDEPAREMPEQT
jgi:Putative prokaryotic signal transducing protein